VRYTRTLPIQIWPVWPVLLCTVTMLAASCASTPSQPVVSPEQHITVTAGFDEVWVSSIKLLREQQLVIDTRDYPGSGGPDRLQRGRIEALQSAGGGWFKRYRQRLVIVIAAGPEEGQTIVAARVVAETYSRGLLTEPAWRERGTPAASLADTFLDDLKTSLSAEQSAVPY